MTATIILASSAQATVQAVCATIEEIETIQAPVVVSSLAQLRFELTNRDDVSVVLVDAALEDSGLDISREVALGNPLTAVLLLIERVEAESLTAAMDAGVRAVLTLPPSVEQYTARLQSALDWAGAAQRRMEGEQEIAGRAIGRIVAMVGAKGGVGVSTLSVLTARECARTGTTCLVDLDVRQGDLAAYCKVRVRRTITDLVSVASEVGGREISEVTYPTKYGLALLPAPDDGELGELMTEVAARQVIQALRYQYDRVVIDCGSHLEDGLAAALDLADEIVVVATPDTPALRSVRRLTAAMERLGLGNTTSVHLILNRASRRAEIQSSSAEKLAGVPLIAEVADVGNRLDGHVNTSSFLDITETHLVGGALAVVRLLLAQTQQTQASGPPTSSEPGQAPVPVPAEVPAPPPPSSPPVQKRLRAGRSGPRRRRGRRSRLKDEGGQVAVEGAVVIVIASVLLFLCFELVLVGAGAVLSHNSAQEAARDYAVGMSQSEVQARVQDRLPAALGDGLTVSSPTGSTVEVTLSMPGLVGLPAPSATAHIDWEH